MAAAKKKEKRRLLWAALVAGTKQNLSNLYLPFDIYGLFCFANKNKNCELSYSWFQTSQTGGQCYPPLVFPDAAMAS